jgi:sulfur relay (sulfurtransferase) complex TusBCD TusD component (DsrE family)
MRSSLEHPPRMLGSTRIGSTSLFVRRLAPQEDKLDLSKASVADLGEVAAFVGACAGAGHARGATRAPKRAWTDGECEELLSHAIELAGIHEAAYLAYSRITGKIRTKSR